MDQLDEALQILYRRARQNAMTEIENVPWSGLRQRKDVAGFLFHYRPGGQQCGRVEISLDSAVVTDSSPGLG